MIGPMSIYASPPKGPIEALSLQGAPRQWRVPAADLVLRSPSNIEGSKEVRKERAWNGPLSFRREDPARS